MQPNDDYVRKCFICEKPLKATKAAHPHDMHRSCRKILAEHGWHVCSHRRHGTQGAFPWGQGPRLLRAEAFHKGNFSYCKPCHRITNQIAQSRRRAGRDASWEATTP